MAKPIAVLYIPDKTSFGYSVEAVDLMRGFNGWDERLQYPDEFKDYLWFVFINPDLTAPEIKVFHEKDFTEMQYNELKSMVEEELSKLKAETQND